jgi:hypothetical protein
MTVTVSSHSVHFTEKVVEALRDQLVDVSGNGATYKGVITAQQLVEVARLIPKEELERLINDIPPIKDFVELAKREPSILFLIHVHVGDCIIVEGMLIPWDKVEFAKAVIRELRKRLLGPDEVSPVVELGRGGRRIFITPLIVESKFVHSLMGDIDDNYEEEGDLMFAAPWEDILTKKEYRLARKEFVTLVAKGKAYIRLWWD